MKFGILFGSKAMDLIINRAKELNIQIISLTVNRKNERSIRLYDKYGLNITKQLTDKFKHGHIIFDSEMTKLF